MSNEQSRQILRLLIDACIQKHNAKFVVLFGTLLHYDKYCKLIVPKAAWLTANVAEGISSPPVVWEDEDIENEHPYEDLQSCGLKWNDHCTKSAKYLQPVD